MRPLLIAGLLLATQQLSAQTRTIDFENVSELGMYHNLLDGYEGLRWSDGFNAWAVVTPEISPVRGEAWRPTSGSNNVSLFDTAWSSFSSDDPFTLNSMMLGAWYDPSASRKMPFDFYGYTTSGEVFEASIWPTETTMELYEFNWENLTKVSVFTAGVGKIMIDDLTITATPEPGTLGLLATGLLLCVWYRRRVSADASRNAA